MPGLILAYHRILPKNPEKNPLVVTTEQFEKQIKYLLRRHPQSFWITFDDGYQDNFLYAFPILKKYNIKATFFVTTGYIGQSKPFYWDYKNYTKFAEQDYCMTWDQLRALNSAGMEIGSHTVHHYELTQLSKEEIMFELAESKRILDKELAQDTKTICYPRGRVPVNIDRIAQSQGYAQGVVTNAKAGSVFQQPRVGIYGHDSFGRFLAKILLRELFFVW
jgi:peptidoglycan/xylan/chitin deacetylase (PgdA/CDA1 family)